MAPKDWAIKNLSDLADVTSGGTPSRSNPEYWGGDIPWVTTAEIINGVITNTRERITSAGVANSSAKIFPKGTILLAMYGQGKTRGKVAHLGINASTNQACAAILPKMDTSGEYLYQNLLSRYEAIRNFSNDGSQKNLSGALVKSIPILVPPLPEQERIGEILSTWDRAIEIIEKLIDNSERQKKALTRNLLTGKQRLRGFSGVYPTVPISEVARIQTGSSNREESAEVGEFTFFDRSTEIRWSDKYLFDTEAIIVGGEGKEFIPKYFVGKFDLHQRAYVLSGFSNAIGRYLFYSLNFSRHLLRRYAVGSTVPSLRMGTFDKVTVWLPSVSEQKAIAKLLSACDTEIDVLNRDLMLLRQEKISLMQQLLTGKRRVRTNDMVESVHA